MGNSKKILLARGCPRSNIDAVEKWNKELPCDKLLVRYVTEFKAYGIMRNYFLEHDYDYLVLATDDIVVKPEHIIQLQKTLDENDFEVVSGFMNVDQNEKVFVNLCQELAEKNKKVRRYEWITRDQIPDKPFFQVKFSGFPLMAIRRDVVKKFVFKADAIFKGMGMEFGASLDLVFCWDCFEAGIPIWVDTKIDLHHLRSMGSMMIGQTAPKITLMDSKGNEHSV